MTVTPAPPLTMPDLPWAVVVQTGPHWTRYPCPDLDAAVELAVKWRADGYTAAVQSCNCHTCIATATSCMPPDAA